MTQRAIKREEPAEEKKTLLTIRDSRIVNNTQDISTQIARVMFLYFVLISDICEFVYRAASK